MHTLIAALIASLTAMTALAAAPGETAKVEEGKAATSTANTPQAVHPKALKKSHPVAHKSKVKARKAKKSKRKIRKHKAKSY